MCSGSHTVACETWSNLLYKYIEGDHQWWWVIAYHLVDLKRGSCQSSNADDPWAAANLGEPISLELEGKSHRVGDEATMRVASSSYSWVILLLLLLVLLSKSSLSSITPSSHVLAAHLPTGKGGLHKSYLTLVAWIASNPSSNLLEIEIIFLFMSIIWCIKSRVFLFILNIVFVLKRVNLNYIYMVGRVNCS